MRRYKSSTFFHAQGLFLRNFKRDIILGSLLKHLILIFLPIACPYIMLNQMGKNHCQSDAMKTIMGSQVSHIPTWLLNYCSPNMKEAVRGQGLFFIRYRGAYFYSIPSSDTLIPIYLIFWMTFRSWHMISTALSFGNIHNVLCDISLSRFMNPLL